jgi:antitoxin VapB
LGELGGRPAAADATVEGLPAGVQPVGMDFDRLRWQLNEAEIERYRKLAPEVGLALETACKAVRPGMTEHELAARIAAELRQRAIRGPVILVANEERVRRFRHPLPTRAKFTGYGMGVCVGERDGLHVSATRLFAFGPIDEDLHRRHEAVNAVDAVMMAATRPDRTLGEIFDACRKAYADGGFADDWKLHHQGGLCGYQARENRATPESPIRVLANQVYGWNPSITGTKSEDSILVLPDRTEIISATGQWPTKAHTAGGMTFERNEILPL